ncbi:HDOD domain-containing protein [Guyparkeria halophila]|uniref:HDOD domain-containing protein n=1 Tax=Guyparkeria halophila TaxID=47960 RepID=UPI0018CC1C1E|nr:HDOD domain-containing protein [Guyparkeria halophila]
MANPALEQAIINKIRDKGISLPVLPDVALRARRIIDDPNSSASDLVEVISQDPAIAARLIQVANSPLYRGAQHIDNLNQIVSRLGMRTVSQLIVSLSAKQLFHANTPTIKRIMRDHWAFSTQVAALANHIARRHTRLDADQALLAGLLHSVGGIPVIVVAEDIPKLQDAPAVLNELVESLQSRLGGNIVKAWDFPDMFAEVIQHCGDLGYQHDGDPNYSDVVICAIAQARGISRTPDDRPIMAAEKLGVDLESSMIDDELDEAIRALGG